VRNNVHSGNLPRSKFFYCLYLTVYLPPCMEKTLRFAIIGCGKIAHRHAAEAVKYGSIRAVCDVDADKAESVAARYNAVAYFSIEQLLASEKNNLDIACICTPNGFHAEHSIQSLHAGLH